MSGYRTQRRDFLKFLAASPLLTVSARLLAEETLLASELPEHLISKPEEALDVFDFHSVAKHTLPPAHYGYLATGTDGNETLSANRRAFEDYYLRPMRMVDTREVSLKTTLLGQDLESPIVLAPVGSQRAFHADAELAVARAARARRHLQILSNVTSNAIEDVIAARGEPVWFQFYPTTRWPTAKMMLERAEAAGATVVVLTVDLNSGSNRVLLEQYIRRAESSRDKRLERFEEHRFTGAPGVQSTPALQPRAGDLQQPLGELLNGCSLPRCAESFARYAGPQLLCLLQRQFQR